MPPVLLKGNPRSLYLLNASDAGRVCVRLDGLKSGKHKVHIFNCFLEEIDDGVLESDGGAFVDLRMPMGGMAVLE